MIYSFERLSQYAVLFFTLIAAWSIVGMEARKAPHLGEMLPGVSRTLHFLVHGHDCRSLFLFPQNSALLYGGV